MEIKFKDLDKRLKTELLNKIDYTFRNRSEEDVAEELLDKAVKDLEPRVHEFYKGLGEVVVSLDRDEVWAEYMEYLSVLV